ncbi:NAD(P)-binding protein [Pelagibius litoralis]|uniref:NAD(P)-binding protein n=1 Tax=Pelagibius litoralis TaxID=374515 RepID=A0A967K9F6_9PROT|nr:hydroxysqualene dehydroxylase HpnE [Pelagibius litoralis]NIA69837.1 NAD(P)-binding protein [Pelagibius litoralis]
MTADRGTPHVHIIGAGLAGLSAAVRLAERGHSIALYEAAAQAGGRCRSFHDAKLDRLIDNGNHLMMTANTAILAYLDLIGARGGLTHPQAAVFPFLDLANGRSWNLRPNRGPIPWWVLDPKRRIPGTGVLSYLKGLRLAFAGSEDRVTDCLDTQDPLWRCFWEPLVIAALNTPANEASARLLRHVLAETFAKGEGACRPLVARHGLGPALVDPALAFLQDRGVAIRFNQRLRRLDTTGRRITALDFPNQAVELQEQDWVILALPPQAAQALLPNLAAPLDHHAIVNAHIRLPKAPDWPFAGAEGPVPEVPFLGLIGGTADWLFLRDDVVSLTVSAASRLAERPNDEIAAALWSDTARALGLDAGDQPPIRVINEKRATFAQTPAALRLRPAPRSAWDNLLLAGDWTDTGLPATIESAVRSGEAAAKALTLP